jgi:hypothetical protein
MSCHHQTIVKQLTHHPKNLEATMQQLHHAFGALQVPANIFQVFNMCRRYSIRQNYSTHFVTENAFVVERSPLWLVHTFVSVDVKTISEEDFSQIQPQIASFPAALSTG